MSWIGELLLLVPLDVLPPTPTAGGPDTVTPRRSQGFAAYLVGGFFGLGIIIVAMILLSLKPKRVDPGWRDKVPD